MSNKTDRFKREELEAEKFERFRKDLDEKRETYLDKTLLGDFSEKPYDPYFNNKGVRFILTPFEKEKFVKLVLFIQKKAPNLNDDIYFPSLREIVKADWIRELDEIDLTGKSTESRLISLIRHLVVRYPIPRFIYNILLPRIENHQYRWVTLQWKYIPLFLHFSKGGSVKNALKEGLLPTVMTAKMNHFFMTQSEVNMKIEEAVRFSQVINLEGDRRIWSAICASRIGQFQNMESDPEMAIWTASETWWQTVIAWICRQPMLDAAQISPILDFLAHRKNQDFSFQLAGRNAVNIIADMERWHEELNRDQLVKANEFKPSGFKSYHAERWDQFGVLETITVKEILSAAELKMEGRAMRHCVVSYAPTIENGRISIWSLKINNVRQITLEVVNRDRAIVQARGKFNRRITESEKNIVRRWCQVSGLNLRQY